MNIPLTIPNLLSLYRIVSFPLVLYCCLASHETWFAILLCVNLVTDILDGWIARRYNMMTEIGARLDSIADLGTYILAFSGVWIFKKADFLPYNTLNFLFLGLFALSMILPFIKFGKSASLHLYSWKIGGYIQGIFFFVLFTFGFNKYLYYFAAVWGILSFIEHIVVQLLLKEMRSNAKGLYWVLSEK